MFNILKAFAPAIVLGGLLSLAFLIPQTAELQSSSMTMELPLRFDLPGWYGIRRQETPAERATLASDTLFSKADYQLLENDISEELLPDVHVSLVFSGNDMNQSIHRPELCLPGQGHLDLTGSDACFQLENGREVRMTRLTSFKRNAENPQNKVNYIHYYTFVGKGNLCHSHMQRMIYDIRDRTLQGKVQRWAYFQIGTYWAPHMHISREDAEKLLQKLIVQLLPRIINWDEMKN